MTVKSTPAAKRNVRLGLLRRASGWTRLLLLTAWLAVAGGVAPVWAQTPPPAPPAAAAPPSPPAFREAQPAVADPALEKRVMAIASELRCLVCQNQTIADSDAGLAVDLRNQVREQLRGGATQREIIDYMTARYGDFVLYRPPVNQFTALLWFGPLLLLTGAIVALILVLRRRARMTDDHFEPDLVDPNAPSDDPRVPLAR